MPHTPRSLSTDIAMQPVYLLEEWVVEPMRLRVTSPEGESTVVEPKMMQVLLYLIQNRDGVVSREELLDAVWPDVVVSDNTLTRCISCLRKVFAGAVVIETVRGMGYQLVSSVELDAPRELQTRPPVVAARRRHRGSLVALTGFLVLALGILVSNVLQQDRLLIQAAPEFPSSILPGSLSAGTIPDGSTSFFIDGPSLSESESD